MFEVIFLFVLGLLAIIFSSIQDLRFREVSNWVNFSLVVFVLGFRFFVSLFSDKGFNFFYQGLIGFGIFFLIGNLFYYSRIFAGGDAKLMISLGPLIPLYSNFYLNLNLFLWFVLIFLISGAIYSLSVSLFIGLKNIKKIRPELKKSLRKYKNHILSTSILGLLLMLSGFYFMFLFFLGLIVFILPYLYVYAKSIDERIMVVKINPSKLREGDWLYKDVKIGKDIIKASWDGLTNKQIKMLKNHNKQVYIRKGIAFVPVFLISYIVFFLIFAI